MVLGTSAAHVQLIDTLVLLGFHKIQLSPSIVP